MTVHFEKDGVAMAMLLDVVEVAQSHSGVNLALAFAAILDEFGISDKVGKQILFSYTNYLHMLGGRFFAYPAIMLRITTP